MTTYTFKSFSDLTLQELYDILRLRQEIFVIEQDCIYQDLDGHDQSAHHILGYLKDQLVAYTRILPPDTTIPGAAAIGRVINHKDNRGKGEGTKLMFISIVHCKYLYPKALIKIHAQSHLENFYKNLGFIQCGEEFLEDGIPHIPMVLNDEN